MLSLFLYVTGQAQTVEKRIYTQAEQQAAQEREEQKRTEEVQDYPVRRSRKKSGKTGLRSRSGQIDIQARRDGLCHLEHQFLFTFGRPGRRSNRPVQQRGAERCRRHYAGRPRFEHQDENRQEGKHQLFHERYRQ